jgi:hypothetical protein
VVRFRLRAIPVAALAAWSYLPNVPLWVVAPAVLVPVVVAQRSGTHEPLMFEASVLAPADRSRRP